MIPTSRRAFITGLVSFVAAPAIVRASNIMPVRSIDDLALLDLGGVMDRMFLRHQIAYIQAMIAQETQIPVRLLFAQDVRTVPCPDPQ